MRHPQADSALHKAWANPAVALRLEDLASPFGLDAEKTAAYQKAAASLPCALKRTHKMADKSRLTFNVSDILDSGKGCA